MNDGELLAAMGENAENWAVEFHGVLTDNVLDGAALSDLLNPAPGELLHGCFCNAIEAGRSAGYVEGYRDGLRRAEELVIGVKEDLGV